MKKALSFIAITSVVTLMVSGASGAITDPLDTTANFFSSFGGTTATGNGDGTVTLTRNTASVDAGIDWRNGGANLSLSTENLLTITPVEPVNGGYWSVYLLFFNSGSFVDEKNWISDTQNTSPQSVDVAQFAVANSVVGANEYFVRFRIQPFASSDVGSKFTEISAVPEPTTMLLVLGALPLAFVLRRRV